MNVNNTRKKEYSGVGCLLAYYILFSMPVVKFYVNTYISMFLLLMLFASVLIPSTKFTGVGGTFFLTSFLYLFLMIVDELTITDQLLIGIWDIFLGYMPLVLGFLLIYNRMDSVIRMAVPMIILTYIIVAITTYIGLQEYPMASRDLASGLYSGVSYTKMNIGGFEFIYSLAVIHPIFIYFLRKQKKTLLALLISFIFGTCLVASQYALALIAFTISLVAYFFPVDYQKKMQLHIFVNIAVVLVIVFALAPEILLMLSEIKFLSKYSDKLLDVANMLRGEEVSMSNTAIRLKLYRRSWESFLNHPLFGSQAMGTAACGGHSYVLDIMARWGIIGISIVAALIVSLLKWYRETFFNNGSNLFALLSLALALFLAFLNPVFWTYELGFIVPIFAYSTRLFGVEEKKIHFRIV